jgi:hypothetical protein
MSNITTLRLHKPDVDGTYDSWLQALFSLSQDPTFEGKVFFKEKFNSWENVSLIDLTSVCDAVRVDAIKVLKTYERSNYVMLTPQQLEEVLRYFNIPQVRQNRLIGFRKDIINFGAPLPEDTIPPRRLVPLSAYRDSHACSNFPSSWQTPPFFRTRQLKLEKAT